MCAALAIFRCQPSSHPFQERHIPLVEAVKIGRSVARARPATNNGIFDCKVLSRNHAILWYDGGKFYLQDTKSSNGTFINNQRLSKGAEDSPASEIFSGDLIQFGVDVMENNRRGEKVTHGCIICTVSLFHPDGQEAKPAANLSSVGPSIQCQELYQLANYLQEALHREQMLEQKLKSLQKLIEDTQVSSESGWQALIDEDRLLSRLEVLESQLHAYSKNHTEDTLRQELVALQEDKRNYETTAKESLRRVLQEKLDAVHKLTDLERSLTDTESECSHLKANCESCQEELEKLAEKHEAQLSEVNQLEEKLQVAEDDHEEALQKAAEEREEVNLQIEEKLKQESSLTAKIEALQADNDFTKNQLTAMKAKLEVLKEKKDDDAEDKDSSKDDQSDNEKTDITDDIDIQIKLDDHQVPHVEIIPLKPIRKQEKESDLEEKLKEVQKQIEEYKGTLQETEGSLKKSSGQVEELQKKLEEAKLDSNQYVAEIAALEERLKLSDYQMNQMLEHAQDDLWLQLKESSKQNMNSACLLQQLKDRIAELEDDDDETTVSESNDLEGEVIMDSLKSNVTLVANHTESTSPGSKQKTEEVDNLQALLLESTDKCHKLESDLVRVKDDYNESVKLADRKSDLIHNLQGELERTKAVQHKYEQDLEETKRQLLQSQQAAKQSSNEAEQVRNKLKILQQELDRENTASTDSNRQAVRAKEFAALKEECANLRKRIQAIEAEMRMSRKENLQLSSDYNKLQESHQKLEALKLRLEQQEVNWQQKLTDTELQLRNANEELATIAHKRSMQSSPSSPSPSSPSLLTPLSSPSLSPLTGHDSSAFITEDYQQLADKCKFLSLCSSIPLLVLMFSLLLALYPMLAEITGTTAPP